MTLGPEPRKPITALIVVEKQKWQQHQYPEAIGKIQEVPRLVVFNWDLPLYIPDAFGGEYIRVSSVVLEPNQGMILYTPRCNPYVPHDMQQHVFEGVVTRSGVCVTHPCPPSDQCLSQEDLVILYVTASLLAVIGGNFMRHSAQGLQ